MQNVRLKRSLSIYRPQVLIEFRKICLKVHTTRILAFSAGSFFDFSNNLNLITKKMLG